MSYGTTEIYLDSIEDTIVGNIQRDWLARHGQEIFFPRRWARMNILGSVGQLRALRKVRTEWDYFRNNTQGRLPQT